MTTLVLNHFMRYWTGYGSKH